MIYDAIVVDLETNGLNPHNSILQFSAFLLKEGIVKKIINRYYYLKENEPLSSAFLIHKLDNFKISQLRQKQNASYPNFFENDYEILSLLKSLSSNALLIAYNTDFETKFLSVRGIEFKDTLDVMKLYTNILKIPHDYYAYKFPKLEEAISIISKRYGVVLHNKLHNALIDSYYTYRLFRCYPNLVQPPAGSIKFWKYFFFKGMFKYYPLWWNFVKRRLKKNKAL